MWSLLFADDNKAGGSNHTVEDTALLQKVLDLIYQWSENNSMRINAIKTYGLRIGKAAYKPEYTAPGGVKIEFKDCFKDLGITFTQDGTFRDHIISVKKKAYRKCGYILRTFENRSAGFMARIFKILVQPYYDYGCQVWSPCDYGSIDLLEGITRFWSKKVPTLAGEHWWDRLKLMNLTSIQRRMERYLCIYMWKILDLQADNPCNIQAVWGHKGRLVELPPLPRSTLGRKLWEQSFVVRAGKAYNSLPRYIRNHVGGEVNDFKKILNSYLRLIPDNPRDVGTGSYPAPTDIVKNTRSNSIIHWRVYLERKFPNFDWH